MSHERTYRKPITHASQLSNSPYISSKDITREVTVNIDGVYEEQVGPADGDKEVKHVMYFKGARKGLVLNKVNGDYLTEAYGELIGDWLGKPVTLYRGKTNYLGKVVACVRIRVPRVEPDPQAAGPEHQTETKDPNRTDVSRGDIHVPNDDEIQF